jgi:hypothetical protein
MFYEQFSWLFCRMLYFNRYLLLSYSLNAQTSTKNCHSLVVILSCEWEKVGAKHYLRLIKKKKEYRQSEKIDMLIQRDRFWKEGGGNYE